MNATATTQVTIADRAEYRDLVARLEAGELIAESTYLAMVDFAKAKKIKRPEQPAEFFVAEQPKAKKAKKAAAPKADRGMTRKECNARLEELGYAGPTSYLMPVLRRIVEWAESDFNLLDTEGVPAAAQAAVATQD